MAAVFLEKPNEEGEGGVMEITKTTGEKLTLRPGMCIDLDLTENFDLQHTFLMSEAVGSVLIHGFDEKLSIYISTNAPRASEPSKYHKMLSHKFLNTITKISVSCPDWAAAEWAKMRPVNEDPSAGGSRKPRRKTKKQRKTKKMRRRRHSRKN